MSQKNCQISKKTAKKSDDDENQYLNDDDDNQYLNDDKLFKDCIVVSNKISIST